MKKLLPLLLLLLGAFQHCAAQWVDTGPGRESLSAISFADPLNGWAGGGNGALFRTKDGGSSWEFLQNFYFFRPHNYIPSIVTLSPDHVVLLWQLASATDPAVIYCSQTKNYNFLPATNGTGDLNTLSFRQPDLGLAVGGTGTLRLSHDQGLSWTNISSGTQNDLWAADSPDGVTAFLVGNKGTLRKSMGPGFSTWQALNTTTAARLTSVWFVTAQQGYIVGDGGTALRTTDGGLTWLSMPVGTLTDLNAVRFLNTTTGFIVGGLGTLMLTTDGGRSWHAEPTNTFETLYSIYSTPDGATTWVAGGNGTVLKRGAVTLAAHDKVSELAWQVYPNPFVSTISVTVPASRDEQTVRLLDMTGRIIMQQHVSATLAPHTCQLKLVEPVTPGVYLIQLVSATRPTETRRLICSP